MASGNKQLFLANTNLYKWQPVECSLVIKQQKYKPFYFVVRLVEIWFISDFLCPHVYSWFAIVIGLKIAYWIESHNENNTLFDKGSHSFIS